MQNKKIWIILLASCFSQESNSMFKQIANRISRRAIILKKSPTVAREKELLRDRLEEIATNIDLEKARIEDQKWSTPRSYFCVQALNRKLVLEKQAFDIKMKLAKNKTAISQKRNL